MTTKKNEIPVFWVLVMVAVGLYLTYLLVVLLVKMFVYFGHNILFFLDAMLQVSAFNPVVVWGILGVFAGGIVGVGIAIKKYHLPNKLILYPVLALVLLVAILCMVNKPAQYSVSTLGLYPTPAETTTPAMPVVKYLYKPTTDITVRERPSQNSAKVFVLDKGTTVEMVKRFEYDARRVEWMKINYNGREGYVNMKYMRRSSNTPLYTN